LGNLLTILRHFATPVNAGFAIERLLEPLPTDEFRQLKPKSYERLLRFPEFLLIRARPSASGT
jgi:hypothetical protein